MRSKYSVFTEYYSMMNDNKEQFFKDLREHFHHKEIIISESYKVLTLWANQYDPFTYFMNDLCGHKNVPVPDFVYTKSQAEKLLEFAERHVG